MLLILWSINVSLMQKWYLLSHWHSCICFILHMKWYDTLGNKVEIQKIIATGSADRDFLVIYSGHG